MKTYLNNTTTGAAEQGGQGGQLLPQLKNLKTFVNNYLRGGGRRAIDNRGEMKAAQRGKKCVRSRKKRQERVRVVVLVVKNSAINS